MALSGPEPGRSCSDQARTARQVGRVTVQSSATRTPARCAATDREASYRCFGIVQLGSRGVRALRCTAPPRPPASRQLRPTGRRPPDLTPSGRRTGGQPGEVGNRCSATGRQLAPSIRASAGRNDGHQARPTTSVDGRAGKSLAGGTIGRLPGTAGLRAHGTGQARRNGPRTRASAPRRSSDRGGTADSSEDGRESPTTHATRKGHWTWRFVWVPWDRHSSGRKRRSGRRFLGGSPLGDHVKVTGWGART